MNFERGLGLYNASSFNASGCGLSSHKRHSKFKFARGAGPPAAAGARAPWAWLGKPGSYRLMTRDVIGANSCPAGPQLESGRNRRGQSAAALRRRQSMAVVSVLVLGPALQYPSQAARASGHCAGRSSFKFRMPDKKAACYKHGLCYRAASGEQGSWVRPRQQPASVLHQLMGHDLPVAHHGIDHWHDNHDDQQAWGCMICPRAQGSFAVYIVHWVKTASEPDIIWYAQILTYMHRYARYKRFSQLSTYGEIAAGKDRLRSMPFCVTVHIISIFFKWYSHEQIVNICPYRAYHV